MCCLCGGVCHDRRGRVGGYASVVLSAASWHKSLKHASKELNRIRRYDCVKHLDAFASFVIGVRVKVFARTSMRSVCNS